MVHMYTPALLQVDFSFKMSYHWVQFLPSLPSLRYHPSLPSGLGRQLHLWPLSPPYCPSYPFDPLVLKEVGREGGRRERRRKKGEERREGGREGGRHKEGEEEREEVREKKEREERERRGQREREKREEGRKGGRGERQKEGGSEVG